MIISVIFLAIILALVIYIVSIYNNLVTLFNRAYNAFSQIDVQLKRRYDLIPNLVTIAQKYLSHEENTLIKVTMARNNALNASSNANLKNAKSLQDLSEAQNSLNSALSNFNMVLENYPNLKANENLTQLSKELTHTENKIAFARQAYNDSVMHYNTARESFPANLIVQYFPKFRENLIMLEFEDKQEISKTPKVNF
ncbi:LemA family protein [Campylobacter armoricus]|uniref:LemA family protein n=2 Tax=Campylobacter armoricus TaxID=2505970 RepID=A0A7L5HWE8_9BACT|nr:LemA family protein [Campylobacter armoricus]QKF79356.1 LemA family protein [Campylobacter armoricus]